MEVRRAGLLALHAVEYSFRSLAERRHSRLLAAWMAPTMVSGGVVRAHLFAVRPVKPKLWEAMVVVEFPIAVVGNRAPGATYDFGATVKTGQTVVHAFNRHIQFSSKDGGPLPDRRMTFVQSVELPAGSYEVASVLSDADGDKVFATSTRVVLPEIVKNETLLVGPLLGRRAERNLVVQSATRRRDKSRVQDDPRRDRMGSGGSFEPILVLEIDKSGPVAAWTAACMVSSRRDPKAPDVERRLVRDDGSAVGSLPPVHPSFVSSDNVRCEPMLDILPIAPLSPGGYRFEVALDPPPEEASGKANAKFAVVARER